MKKILAITPIHVGPEELARRQDRYRTMLPAGFSLELVDVDAEAPRALDTPEDLALSDAAIVRRVREASSDYDWIMPDCVLDPLVPDLQAQGVPVIGILRTTLLGLQRSGRRCAAVARNQVIADAMVARAAGYGLADVLSEARVLGLDVTAITDHDAWSGALGREVAHLRTEGFDWIVNGCSAVDLPGDATGVLDPLAAAFAELGSNDREWMT